MITDLGVGTIRAEARPKGFLFCIVSPTLFEQGQTIDGDKGRCVQTLLLSLTSVSSSAPPPLPNCSSTIQQADR